MLDNFTFSRYNPYILYIKLVLKYLFSMKYSFCDNHILLILKQYQPQNKPLDAFLSIYLRNNKSIGSKDRKYIANTCYGIIRWQGLLDYLVSSPITLEKRLEKYLEVQSCCSKYVDDTTIPLHIRLSFPKTYFTQLQNNFNIDKVIEYCLISNTQAPTTIRVNLLKAQRQQLYDSWKDIYDITLSKRCDTAIHFNKKINFFASEEFKSGKFEIQDEASQIVSSHITPHPKDLVLDYCAGAGGKTLAISPLMNNTGQIYLHDIRTFALLEAKKRLKRAGIMNAQLLMPDSPTKDRLKNKINWLILDVPCSGSGTLRRNPDMKWKFSDETIPSLVALQRKIFDEAIVYVKKQGYIAYITCSIFKEENEEQIEYFIKTYNLKRHKPSIALWPKNNEGDGFFLSILKKI
jgi:16S rRNA (cytosine967-C5)-methyltransferase